MLKGKFKEHEGHNIVCVEYGDGVNYSVECEDCNEVLVSADKDTQKVKWLMLKMLQGSINKSGV